MKIGFAVLLICTLARCLEASDRVEVRDGKTIVGKIVKESPTEVVVSLQGKAEPHTVSCNRIVRIHYDGQSASMSDAGIKEKTYELRRAADQYAQAQVDAQDQPLIRLAAQFGEARVRARLALDEAIGVNEAIARLEELLRDHPDSRHYFPTLELLARLLLDHKDYTKAAQAFEELGTSPWAESRLRSTVLQARMLREQSRADDAMARLDEVLAVKPDSPELERIQAEALLERAGCLREQNDRAAEIETLVRLLGRKPAPDAALEAHAYIALGDAYRATQNPKEALMAYLHVELLFAKHKELHARALYNLSQVWSELGQPDRCAATQSTLKSEYPNSRWTKKLGS